MEIEAKFAIPNRDVYRQLVRLRMVAGYELVPAGSAEVTDEYFDTADARLLAAGYTCRLRAEAGQFVATLKGLGGVSGVVHRRDEQEVRLPEKASAPARWPESAARTLALELSGAAPLQLLFQLSQQRTRADVMDGARRVAQLSLDAVRAAVGQRPALYYELEVELAPDGSESDLAVVTAALADGWQLTPEPRSKFARALEALRSRGTAVESLLSAAERAEVELHAAGPDAELARRAAVVLGWADGLPTREIVARSGLSDSRVRFWLRMFRGERLGIFREPAGGRPAEGEQAAAPQPPQPKKVSPAKAKPPSDSVAAPPSPPPPSGSPPPPVPPAKSPAPQTRPAPARVPAESSAQQPTAVRARRGLPTLAAFCAEHGVDAVHARFVAKQAEALFSVLRSTHQVPRKRRRLMQQAAWLLTIGQAHDPERPHRAGRDLILAQPLRDVSTLDRLALACIVAFQRGKVRPDREPTMAALEPKQREIVLALAALLKVAAALDFSRTQATRLHEIEGAATPSCEVTLDGPAAEVDALQASARAGLWCELFKQELVFQALPSEAAPPLGSPAPAAALAAAPRPVEIPPIRADEPMCEAGRKIMYLHFTRMLANEEGTRLGEDIEALHDMRVSTRRMRAAYQIFAEYFDPKVLKPFNKGLRRTGRLLGAVRDLDVLLEKAEAYAAALTPEEAGELEPLLAEWRARRELARRQMLEYLDSAVYRGFVAGFRAFLTTPGAGALPIAADQPQPYQVRHVIPRLLLTRYEQVRAYGPIIADAPLPVYHMLRIDCKRLRYALEFFVTVLGPEVPGLIKQVTLMQDVLGALQDAHVAEGLIREFLDARRGKRKKKLPPVALDGVANYLAAQQAAQGDCLGVFPGPWAALIGADFRRTLALAAAAP